MSAPIQSSYGRHQQAGWPGSKAKPGAPMEFVTGPVGVPTNGTKPKPGYGVYYNKTNKDFRVPTSLDQSLLVEGIVIYDAGTVQGSQSTPSTGANSDTLVAYEHGRVVKIGIFGTFFAVAGEALEFGDLVVFDHGTDKDWIKHARAIADFDAAEPAAYSGTVNAEGLSTYVQGAITGLNDGVSAYVRGAIKALPKSPAVAVSSAAEGGLVELRFAGLNY